MDDQEAIRLYCGLSERRWNSVPVPDDIGPFMAAANNLGKPIEPGNADVIVDSGAFGDERRLSFSGALERQLAFEQQMGFTSYALVAYDQLIDEKWDGSGNRRKARWTENEALSAIEETIAANEFLALADTGERKRVHPIQGVTAKQQEYCADEVIPMIADDDILGLGGWCIIGWAPPTSNLRRSLEWTFWDSMWRIIPRAAAAGINHVHIFGVMVANVLGGLLWLCDEYGINLVSTDSSGPATRPASCGIWGYADWQKRCYFPPGPQRGAARIEHVRRVKEWLARFRDTQYYKCPPKPIRYQLRLF